jgi:hypothetical protein
MTTWILDVCDLRKVSSGTIVGVWRLLGVMNVNRGEEGNGMVHIFSSGRRVVLQILL